MKAKAYKHQCKQNKNKTYLIMMSFYQVPSSSVTDAVICLGFLPIAFYLVESGEEKQGHEHVLTIISVVFTISESSDLPGPSFFFSCSHLCFVWCFSANDTSSPSPELLTAQASFNWLYDSYRALL